METLYGLKRKTTNRWLKLLLLLFVAVGIGIPNLNAQTKSIKVASDKELVEALHNPSVSTIMLEAGFYATLNRYAETGTKVVKQVHEGGNRDLRCEYYIVGSNTCFDGIPGETFVNTSCEAGYNEPVPPCNCCPVAENLGTWSVISQPGGSTVNFLLATNFQSNAFEVDQPGSYILRYTWGAPYNSLVETEYIFYGPVTVDLSAPDVCGLSTTVDFGVNSILWDPDTEIDWTLDGEFYDGPDATELFELTVDECGVHVLSVTVTPAWCPPVTKTITIDFACQPIADAGPDVNVCDDICYYSLVGSYGGVLLSPTHAWSWVELSSPPDVDLVFNAPTALETGVCADDLIDDCPYGEFEVEFQVQNGECYDSDTMLLRFYQQPVAIAGPDQHLCNTFSFSLAAVPFDYCGEEGVNYWSEHHWELVSQVGDGEVVTIVDPTVPTASVIINTSAADCAFGAYEFKWVENNSKGLRLGGCTAEDNVVVTIYEDPDIDAGADMIFCNTFAFSLFGIGDEPCYENTVVVYSWEKSAQPGHCDVAFTPDDEPGTWVEITNCEPCEYGKYIFTFTQSNGYLDEDDNFVSVCSTSDDVTIWNFQDPDADAGLDQHLCNTFAFTLTAVPTEFCGDPIRENEGNYNTWGEWTQVSGPAEATFDDAGNYETAVTIDTDGVECPFGEFVFMWTEYNGFENDVFEGCQDEDLVSVFIYEEPALVDAGDAADYCGSVIGEEGIFSFPLDGTVDEPCNLDMAYTFFWAVEDQPGTCDVSFTPNSIDPTVTITNCGLCAYGEYVFSLTQQNGYFNDAGEFVMVCEFSDEVSVVIFEEPIADPGDDYAACVDAYTTFYTYMSGNSQMDYCYSMYGVWTKSCGPGDVIFTDINDPNTQIEIPHPGRYVFTWTLSNDACEDAADVVFDLVEMPEAIATYTEDQAACDELCYSLAEMGIVKYEYFGTDAGDCPNFTDLAHWSYVDGPIANYLDPTTVSFANDEDPATELCVSFYGAYTVRWNEVNKLDNQECSDYVDVFVEFYETPTPDAGDDDEICGNCYTLLGVPYQYEPFPNQHQADYYYWESLSTNSCYVEFGNYEDAVTTVCIPNDYPYCYGEYGFVLHESNGDCYGTDTVYITFNKVPDPIAICFVNENDCVPFDHYTIPPGQRELEFGCLVPNDTIYVCADDCTSFSAMCQCGPSFNWWDPAYFGWTFEWSVVAPAGTTVESVPGYYDFDNNHWIYPTLDICWGECCDYARIYLTITTPKCVTTIVYYVYVAHKPCANIEGPDVSDVGTVTQYCNVCPPEFDQSCLLYNWTAEHCGTIESGQGTECIEVLWTDYNINGGWGEITLTVFDTCTGCCNYDEMPVKIWPTGTIGNDTLSGYVYYHNAGNTPLNGVEIQLWNGGIPVMSTESSNDVEGGGMGYYEIPGINGVTEFGITASYDAPWYGYYPSGVNATDALAVQLKVIDAFPLLFDDVVGEAMDVNNSGTISATDALWIKQRAIGMVTYFPAGDWAFDPAMSSAAGTYDIYTLNTGDANRSIIPNSMKAAPAIDLVTDGTMNVVTGQVFALPIRVADASQFGAITLDLGYDPALIEVVDVIPVDGMIANITDGNVIIAYTSVNPMILAENEVVVTLKVKAISPFTSAESMFTIGQNSEFADGTAKVVEPVTLKSFGVTTDPAATDYFLSANRPNPFSNSTFIEYTMPESGKVKLSVLDMLGQEIAVLVDATQGAGSYTVEFSAAGLATGVYIYKITVDGESRDFISTQRMVISH
jgi:hypothetical protein